MPNKTEAELKEFLDALKFIANFPEKEPEKVWAGLERAGVDLDDFHDKTRQALEVLRELKKQGELENRG
jgi:hypothetical protein